MVAVTGYCLNWIQILVRRYNRQGPLALIDQRHRNPGAAAILSTEQQAQLVQALDASPPEGDLWTGRQVAQWIQTHTGRQVHPKPGWEYLKRLNTSLRVLRPRHAKADPAAQEAFKKTFPNR